MLPTVLIAMDGTILGFAVPRLSEALAPTSTQLLWIVDTYSFVLAGLLVTMGTLGDRIGRRRLLMMGAAGFSAASLLAAYAPNTTALIAARALLGVAGATLMPSTLSLIRNVFPDPRRRQTAIAVWAAGFAVGGAIGPVVGGILLDHFWWGSIFLVGAPVTGALLVLAPRFLPESADPSPGRFDLASAALSMLTMFPFVYALKHLAEHGLSTGAVLALGIGAVAGVAFVARQRGLTDPMIDVTLFRVRAFRTAVAGNLVACMGIAGSLFFVTQFFQLVSGLTATRAGLVLLPANVVAVSGTLLAPRLARRLGAFQVIAAGMAFGAVGFVLLSRVSTDGGLVVPVVAMLALFTGVNMAMAVSVDGIMSAIPANRAGAGASVSETANELGIALGTAVLGSVMVAIYRRDLGAVPGVSEPLLARARETLGAAELAAADGGGAVGEALRHASHAAFVHGVSIASLAAAVLCAAVAVLALRVRVAHPS